MGDYTEERHLVEKEGKGELQPSSRKKVGARVRETSGESRREGEEERDKRAGEEESRTGGGGRTLRSRGMKESRVAAEGLVMLVDETRRAMEGCTCRRDD